MATRSRYQLFYSLRSPFARRIRVALSRLAIDYEPKEINVFEPTEEFLNANPLGLVPVLVVHPGAERIPIPDSATILEYLHENYGEKIWPADLATRATVRAASTLAEGLMAQTVQWHLEHVRPQPSAEWLREHVENIDRTLATIHSTNLKRLPWKVSDFQLTQAGYDLYIALDYMTLRLKGLDWPTKYPELSRFLDLHRNRQDLVPSAPPPA